LTQNYPDKPEEYPNMDYYKNHELTAEQWGEIFLRLKKNNPDIFLILYGGEIFLYDGLADVLKFLHKEKIAYTVITNNTDEIQPRIEKVYSEVGTLMGISSSVDPLIFSLDPERYLDSDRLRKCIDGLKRLEEMEKGLFANDVVAEITADKTNIQFLYKTIEELSDRGIWSDVTCIDSKPTNFYDFSSITDPKLLLHPEDVNDVFTKIKENKKLLIHTRKILDELQQGLPCNIKCNMGQDVHNVTIAPDGTFRLCLRIRGLAAPGISLNEIISSEGIIQEEFKRRLAWDYRLLCKGCNWPCILMSKYEPEEIINHV
jgi:MoaA/NifB/PqqE/SkfB family radical SAM enzyme